ncbi:MAG: hypothetical protein VXW43_19725, partial [Pseudomonadota bacterium]|nr:hypothetical protein [Pseudomonadota bacterium]
PAEQATELLRKRDSLVTRLERSEATAALPVALGLLRAELRASEDACRQARLSAETQARAAAEIASALDDTKSAAAATAAAATT